MNKELLEKALEIAIKAHKGQVDKAGEIYVFHPIRVAQRCETDDEKIVALLHDTIEDTDVTEDYLIEQGFPMEIVDAVLGVTREEKETYEEFIRRCALNPLSRKVKLHDLEDNMDVRRLKELTEKDMDRLNKYLRAYRYLSAEK
ncbi:MAG: HD domain-containing protein [Prevotella sp.]